MLFFPLINVKLRTFVGILTFMSRKNLCSVELSMKKRFITSGPGLSAIVSDSETSSLDVWITILN